MYYSIRWECLSTHKNFTQVQTTFLDEQGHVRLETTYYEGWIGVCTRRIDRVVEAIQHHFPGHPVRYQLLGNARKILPYFDARLARGKLDSPSKPFYKLYTTACIKNVGRFFHCFKMSYYEPDDWLVRLYIDLCTQYDSYSFYYQWYTLHPSPHLMKAFHMVPDRKDSPHWTFAAFDLESVPLQGNHVPQGHHPSDRIVMMSLYKWNRDRVDTWLLYVLPPGIDRPLEGYPHGFATESAMLIRFHELLQDVHVLTGYNINAFDFPCIFARLVWLHLTELLPRYRSRNVGTDLVVSYHPAYTLDLYAYFKTFSGYNLPSYKLDDVARVKLKGETKLAVKATGLWSYYRHPGLPRDLFESDDAERCFHALRPKTVTRPSDFGTFRTYLDYCLRDSELVYRLFEKEWVLSFLVERANFTSLNVVEALHFGNSRYLLELFKTYGTRLGYFLNPRFFGTDDASKYQALLGSQKTYQGALNFCYPETHYEDVVVMDFASMYPSVLRSSRLCYGTCTLMARDEWLATPAAQALTTIPYRHHSDRDFLHALPTGAQFAYPRFDPEHDAWAIVIHPDPEAFLPRIVSHFLEMRQHHQRQWKATQLPYHYNVQLGLKILINSLYGVMANKESPLAYLAIAMIIVTLSRYQLLGSYHFLKNQGYTVCYADTDSLMVHRWPEEHCEAVNAFLGLPHVSLQFEQRMKCLLVLSKKRYVYESADGGLVTKGFQKKVNGLIEFMTHHIVEHVWRTLFRGPDDTTLPLASQGWILWADTVQEAQYRCRDPKKYALYRKVQRLEDYKSDACPAVKYLQKYPHKTDEHVEFTYSLADIAAQKASSAIIDVEDCQGVNYEQLFVYQKRILCTLINVAYWHLPDPTFGADMVLNALHWRRFVHAELRHWHATGRHLLLMFEPGMKYTFTLNDHVPKRRKRKGLNLGLDTGGGGLSQPARKHF